MTSQKMQRVKGLGLIPNDWEVIEANSLCSKITKGTTPPNGDLADKGEIPFLRVTNLTFQGRPNFNDLKYVSREIHSGFLARSKAYPGDILMNIVGPPLGQFALLNEEFGEYNLNQAVIIFRASSTKITNAYLLHYLMSSVALKWLESFSKKTSGQQNLTIQLCKNLPIPVPSAREQRVIVKTLATWDRAIEKTEALIEAKERRKAGLMQRLLTGKVRFGGFGPVANGTPPKDWDICRLEDICKRVTRKNPDGITHVLTASGEHGLVDQRDYFNRSVAGESLANYYLLKKGEFAYNRSSMKGYPYGAIKRLDRYEAGLLSSLYLCFRITSEKVDSDYLRHFFDSPILNKELRGIVQVGARAHGLLNVSTGDFMRLRVCMPSLKEQKRIATCLNAATAEIKEHRNHLAALKEQKKGLMQQLLTGKMRVNHG